MKARLLLPPGWSSGSIRRMWTVIAIATALALVAQPTTRQATLWTWFALNGCYAAWAIIWAIFHPRPIFRNRSAGRRGIGWLSLIATLICYSLLFSAFERMQGTGDAVNQVALALFVSLALCPLIFLALSFAGLAGAAIAGYASRSRLSAIDERVQGVLRNIYAGALVLILGGIGAGVRIDYYFALIGSIPILTALLYRFSDSALLSKIARLAKRVPVLLSFRWSSHGNVREIDTRGALAGALAACLVLLIPTSVIRPLRTYAISMIIRSRNSVEAMIARARAPHPIEGRADIVVLTLDGATRRRIIEPGANVSEAAIQARAIARLTALGAREIVLPAPALHLPPNALGEPALLPSGLVSTARDMPQLVKAIERARCVLLALPSRDIGNKPAPVAADVAGAAPQQLPIPDAVAQRDASELGRMAQGIVSTDLDWTGSVRIPIVPATGEPPPEPRLLASLIGISRRRSLPALRSSASPEMIDFTGQGSELDFEHVSYADLLAGGPIWSPVDAEGMEYTGGQWLPATSVFRGKVVLLAALDESPDYTLLGNLSRQETLAYATSTLLSGQSLHPLPHDLAVLLALAVGLYVGAAAYRLQPLDAGWRVALVWLAIALLSMVVYVGRSVWIDPVAPLLTVVIAVGLSTQISFMRETSERQRTRELFQRFVAADQVDRWLRLPDHALRLGGQRQRVCVLFADMRNFTGFAEKHDAEQVIQVVNLYMDALTRALHRFGGVLDKYTGDGLMAWFAVGEPAAPCVAQAVEAALAMRDAAAEVSSRQPADNRLDLGFGLHCGDAVVGLIGSEDLQVNWTALGLTVVVSARLQTAARGGEVVVSDAVHELTKGLFEVSPGERILVKGLHEPILAYRVLSAAHVLVSEQPVCALPPPVIPA